MSAGPPAELPCGRRSGCLRGQPGCAVRRVSVAAVGARSAGCERQDGMITRRDGCDGTADLLDDPSAFVAENSGQRERQAAAGDTQVSVTQASRSHPDENLALAKLVQFGRELGRRLGAGSGPAPGRSFSATGPCRTRGAPRRRLCRCRRGPHRPRSFCR